jgi:hypothetical protein
VAGSGHATEAGRQNDMAMEVLRNDDTQEIQLIVSLLQNYGDCL